MKLSIERLPEGIKLELQMGGKKPDSVILPLSSAEALGNIILQAVTSEKFKIALEMD